jgi:hypothetical protein
MYERRKTCIRVVFLARNKGMDVQYGETGIAQY